MSAQTDEIYLEGVIAAPGPEPGEKPFGAILECEREEWVLSYEENSPFRPFHRRKVGLSGKPYTPKGQHLIDPGSRLPLNHLELASMRLLLITPDAQILEVGRREIFRGRFKRSRAGRFSWKTALWFVTQHGKEFLVANNPEHADLSGDIDVAAYPVKPVRPNIASVQHLWITGAATIEDV